MENKRVTERQLENGGGNEDVQIGSIMRPGGLSKVTLTLERRNGHRVVHIATYRMGGPSGKMVRVLSGVDIHVHELKELAKIVLEAMKVTIYKMTFRNMGKRNSKDNP